MEDEHLDADPPLVEELNPEHVGDAAPQADQELTDNPEEVARKSEPLPSWKKRGKSIGTAMAMLVAAALALVSGARYLASRESQSSLHTPQIPQLALDNASMRKYLNDLDEAAEEMEDEWESASLKVRRAFQRHFTPSLWDDQKPISEPLAIILEHVDKMQKCKVPPQSSEKARRDFALHLQFLRSICRIVTLRLEELNWFVHMNNKYGLPVPVPGHDMPYNYPALREPEPEESEDGLVAADFMHSVGLFGGDTEQKVGENLAEALVYMLDIWNRSYIYNMMARYYFEPFLQHFAEDAVHASGSTSAYQIPYTGRAFRAGTFSQAAAYIFRQSDSTPSYEEVRKLHRIAENWTPQGVLDAAKRQEKLNTSSFPKRLNTRREQMRRLLKQGIPRDDLLICALFLL
ncbi:hypothetical protein, conserved [Eimeria brunetti]|uniref:Uncharacterized protein n=1 Tax=Eimeria brunetti TaxID=51314 RepID=U6LL19_9EIME|nr:hypothetical protein, conserved [Eimeria brunetti]